MLEKKKKNKKNVALSADVSNVSDFTSECRRGNSYMRAPVLHPSRPPKCGNIGNISRKRHIFEKEIGNTWKQWKHQQKEAHF
eukprot:4743857-Amphidinium_carterae.1